MKLCACGCGQPRDREGQRYRKACHTAYMQRWRARQVQVPKALQARYLESRDRLRVEVDAFFAEGR